MYKQIELNLFEHHLRSRSLQPLFRKKKLTTYKKIMIEWFGINLISTEVLFRWYPQGLIVYYQRYLI